MNFDSTSQKHRQLAHQARALNTAKVEVNGNEAGQACHSKHCIALTDALTMLLRLHPAGCAPGVQYCSNAPPDQPESL